MIETYHPTNPETREKFSPFDSITVHKFSIKIWDACGFIQIINFCQLAKSRIKKALNISKKDKSFKRPETMNDLPDSDSSDDPIKNDTYKGLSEAAIHLGEGAVLYLQMMKTLAILFFLLTLINIPLCALLESSTRSNSYAKFTNALKYFSIGNLAVPEQLCSYSHILYQKSADQFDGSLKKPQQFYDEKALKENMSNIDIKCKTKDDYIRDYDKIGFIQTLDAKKEQFFTVEDQCKLFEDSKYHI